MYHATGFPVIAQPMEPSVLVSPYVQKQTLLEDVLMDMMELVFNQLMLLIQQIHQNVMPSLHVTKHSTQLMMIVRKPMLNVQQAELDALL